MKLFSAILMVMAATAMAQDADIPEVDPSNDMHQDYQSLLLQIQSFQSARGLQAI